MASEKSIKLYHFGEALISAILAELSLKEILEFLKLESFCPLEESDTIRDEKIAAIEASIGSSLIEIETLKPIKSNFEKYILEVDTQHTLDLGIFSLEKAFCFPIEVKMGTTGDLVSWSKFQSYMVENPIKERIREKETDKHFLDGAMSSFLAGFTGSVQKEYKLVIENKEREFTMSNWGLCIRRGNKKSFKKTEVKEHKIINRPLIFTFEDLIEFYNDTEKGKVKSYTVLVGDILENSKTYLLECIKATKDIPKDGYKNQKEAKEKNKLT
jgi:hypothetical protein